jgi:hypothetical protein
MTTCRAVTRDVLPNPVDVRIDEDLDFNTARIIADARADEMAGQPMLLAWYDSKTGRFSPDVTCCSEEKPGWVVYAESRGGDLSIDINEEAFVFIYKDLAR